MQQISRIPSGKRGKHTRRGSSQAAVGAVTPPSIQKIKWALAISVENTGGRGDLMVCFYLLLDALSAHKAQMAWSTDTHG